MTSIKKNWYGLRAKIVYNKLLKNEAKLNKMTDKYHYHGGGFIYKKLIRKRKGLNYES